MPSILRHLRQSCHQKSPQSSNSENWTQSSADTTSSSFSSISTNLPLGDQIRQDFCDRYEKSVAEAEEKIVFLSCVEEAIRDMRKEARINREPIASVLLDLWTEIHASHGLVIECKSAKSDDIEVELLSDELALFIVRTAWEKKPGIPYLDEQGVLCRIMKDSTPWKRPSLATIVMEARRAEKNTQGPMSVPEFSRELYGYISELAKEVSKLRQEHKALLAKLHPLWGGVDMGPYIGRAL